MAMLFKNAQNGAALITSLVILLVLTLIGIAAISRGAMQMTIAGNSQQSAMSFAAAQSASNGEVALGNLGTNWAVAGQVINDSIIANPTGSAAANAVNQSVVTCRTSGASSTSRVTTSATASCDQATDLLATNSSLRGRSMMFFRGKSPGSACKGYSSNMGNQATVTCYYFEVQGTGWFDNVTANGLPDATETQSQITQWAWMLGAAAP